MLHNTYYKSNNVVIKSINAVLLKLLLLLLWAASVVGEDVDVDSWLLQLMPWIDNFYCRYYVSKYKYFLSANLRSWEHVRVHEQLPGLGHGGQQQALVLGEVHGDGGQLGVSLEVEVGPVHQDVVVVVPVILALNVDSDMN